MKLRRLAAILAPAALALATLPAMAAPAPAAPSATQAPAPLVQLWRLDCGGFWIANLDDFSDTRAYGGRGQDLVGSCYLIRHGDQYLLWDTGLSRDLLGKPLVRGKEDGETLKVSIVDQLKVLGISPDQVAYVGVSHYHYDHTGQAADFPKAKLLIGKGDWDVIKGGGPRAAALKPWVAGERPAEPVSGDKDVFGDGRVVMLDLPGHTPGHHGLMVRLDKTGWVLLSGDAAHFRENLDNDGVPTFNADRAQTLASLDRFRRLGRNLKAVVIVQHDPRDVAKLPVFPKAAE